MIEFKQTEAFRKWRGIEIVILLCGGDKSSQARGIETAKQLAEEWRQSNV
jgi:putative component of toxin-antitoxin plasmid stabilization module